MSKDERTLRMECALARARPLFAPAHCAACRIASKVRKSASLIEHVSRKYSRRARKTRLSVYWNGTPSKSTCAQNRKGAAEEVCVAGMASNEGERGAREAGLRSTYGSGRTALTIPSPLLKSIAHVRRRAAAKG
eukprot:2774664-Pleurochrysis_carterae.AAC.1